MRIKNVFKNLISEMLPQIAIAFLGIYRSKVFLTYLGTDVVGLYNLFAQILGYLSLVEGGLGTAVIYRLYKPISEKDYDKLAEIRAGIKRIFNIIILCMIGLALLLSLIIPFLIKDNKFSVMFILTNFMLYVLSEVVLYKTIFERSLYIATEKNYKLNMVVKTTLVIKTIIEICAAMLLKNLTGVLISSVITNVIGSYLIYIISKKDFKFIKKSSIKDYAVLKDVKNLITHRIAGMVSSNIDIILLSSFIGLDTVVIYSTYLLYMNALTSLMNKISNAFLGSIGNKIIEDVKDSYRIFKEYNALMFFIAIIIGVQFFFSIDCFINLWYNNQVKTSIGISILFSMLLIYNILRMSLVTFTEAAGLFKETKICPIIEAIVNLILSLILVKALGIEGLLIGTFLALFISEFLIKPHIIFRKIFNKSGFEYYKISYKFIIILIIEMIIVYVMKINIIHFERITSWFLYSAIFGLINICITMLIYIFMKQTFLIDRIKQIFIKKET